MEQDANAFCFCLFGKKCISLIKRIRARVKICIFQLFILILQPFLGFYIVI